MQGEPKFWFFLWCYPYKQGCLIGDQICCHQSVLVDLANTSLSNTNVQIISFYEKPMQNNFIKQDSGNIIQCTNTGHVCDWASLHILHLDCWHIEAWIMMISWISLSWNMEKYFDAPRIFRHRNKEVLEWKIAACFDLILFSSDSKAMRKNPGFTS